MAELECPFFEDDEIIVMVFGVSRLPEEQLVR